MFFKYLYFFIVGAAGRSARAAAVSSGGSDGQRGPAATMPPVARSRAHAAHSLPHRRSHRQVPLISNSSIHSFSLLAPHSSELDTHSYLFLALVVAPIDASTLSGAQASCSTCAWRQCAAVSTCRSSRTRRRTARLVSAPSRARRHRLRCVTCLSAVLASWTRTRRRRRSRRPECPQSCRRTRSGYSQQSRPTNPLSPHATRSSILLLSSRPLVSTRDSTSPIYDPSR